MAVLAALLPAGLLGTHRWLTADDATGSAQPSASASERPAHPAGLAQGTGDSSPAR